MKCLGVLGLVTISILSLGLHAGEPDSWTREIQADDLFETPSTPPPGYSVTSSLPGTAQYTPPATPPEQAALPAYGSWCAQPITPTTPPAYRPARAIVLPEYTQVADIVVPPNVEQQKSFMGRVRSFFSRQSPAVVVSLTPNTAETLLASISLFSNNYTDLMAQLNQLRVLPRTDSRFQEGMQKLRPVAVLANTIEDTIADLNAANYLMQISLEQRKKIEQFGTMKLGHLATILGRGVQPLEKQYKKIHDFNPHFIAELLSIIFDTQGIHLPDPASSSALDIFLRKTMTDLMSADLQSTVHALQRVGSSSYVGLHPVVTALFQGASSTFDQQTKDVFTVYQQRLQDQQGSRSKPQRFIDSYNNLMDAASAYIGGTSFHSRSVRR